MQINETLRPDFINPKVFGAAFAFALCAFVLFDPARAENEAGTHYSGPIIDMHAHAFSQETHGWFFGMTHPPTLRGETYLGVATAEEQKVQTLQAYRRHNVVKAVVSGGELWAKEAPDLVLFGSGLEPIDQLRKQFEAGKLDVIGELAPFYAGMKADDQEILAYFALAEELGVPIGIHIFPGGPNGGLYQLPQLAGMRAANANPMQLEAALIAHPGARVYVMHGGWPYLEDMKALMYAHPQVYLDIAVINWIFPENELHDYLESLIRAGFGDRIMYGSDQMVWPQTIGIGIRSVDSAPFLSAQQKEDIFYNNAARFLRFEPNEIERHKNGLRQ